MPLTLPQAPPVFPQTPPQAFVQSALHQPYPIPQTQSNYPPVPQRSLIVHSEKLSKPPSEPLQRHLSLSEKQFPPQLSPLSHKTFPSPAHPFQAPQAFPSEHLQNHHPLHHPQIVSVPPYRKRAPPPKRAQPQEIPYPIKPKLKRHEPPIAEEFQRSPPYILPTNIPSQPEQLTNHQLLTEYKRPQSVEPRFRFLSHPLFFTSSVFVKTPPRVAAIAIVIPLCLFVYAIPERSLREALPKTRATIPHQRGKPTQPPTLPCVFQLFHAVHLLSVHRAKQSPPHRRAKIHPPVLTYVGYYLLSSQVRVARVCLGAARLLDISGQGCDGRSTHTREVNF